jgi:hypothetical protein
MPYVHRKAGPNKVCVYKKLPGGKPGKKVGCTTPANLNDYLAALHIHGDKRTKK